MNKNSEIKAILVDDEPSAIENLTILLNEYCDKVNIVATASCVDDALVEIEKYQPHVVFLDIEMPEKTGFDLLEETKQEFQTVFVTAYDEYAIQAFEVSAVDYLLKPVSIERLKKTVCKLEPSAQKNVEILKENIQSDVIEKIVVPHSLGQKVIAMKDIICIEASSSYSIIHYEENSSHQTQVFSKSLRYFDELTENNPSFYRSQRSWLINLEKVNIFVKREHKIILNYNVEAYVSRTKQKELAELIKA